MSARSNKIRSAHSRSGKRDKDSQPWWPVSSLSPACSGGGTRPLLAAFRVRRVLLVQGHVCRDLAICASPSGQEVELCQEGF